MGSYAEPRYIWHVNVGASVSDNTDVSTLKLAKPTQVFGLEAALNTPSPTTDAIIELVNTSDAIQASVSIEGTADDNNIDSTASRFPLTLAAGTYKLRTDQATGAGCDVDIRVHMSYPGVNAS